MYHKWQSYDVWFLRYGVEQTNCFVILDCFLPFHPPNNFKNQNFENTQKPPGDIIILHRFTINDNHMMYRLLGYGVWWTEFFVILKYFLPFYPLFFSLFWKNEQNTWRYYHFTHLYHKLQSYNVWFLRHQVWKKFLSFWIIFCLFTPITTQKIQILYNKKNSWIYYHFHMCTINDNHIMYGSWDIKCNRHNFLSFWTIFALLPPPPPPPPLTTPKIQILKKWKTHLEIL